MLEKEPLVGKMIQILNCFSFEKEYLGISEIHRETGIAKGTIHRILGQLLNYNIIEKDDVSNKYCLGMTLFRLGSIAGKRDIISAQAMPLMKKLVEKTNETVLLLTYYDEFTSIYVNIIECSQPIRYSPRIGDTFPLYLGAGGLCLMANLSDSQISRIIERDLRPTASGCKIVCEDLLSSLKNIKDQNYAIAFGERIKEVVGIAAPVRNHLSKVVYSLSLVIPLARYRENKENTLINMVQETALEISRALGYHKI